MKKDTRLLVLLSFLAIYIIWGSTFLLNKIIVKEVPPFYLASIRFTSAGIILFSICFILKKPIKITLKEFQNTTIAGFMFLVYGNGVFVWSLQYIDSGFAALEASIQSLIILLLLWIIDGKKPKLKSIIGVLLGSFGMFLLLNQKGIHLDGNSFKGMLAILSCVICWSFANIFVSKATLPSNFLVSSSYQMLSAGLILFVVSLSFGEEWSSIITWSSTVKWNMLLLIIFGSIIAFSSFNYLLKTVSPEKVATSAYVNPIIALFLGWYFLNEQISTQSMIAGGILLTGVYFINSSKKGRKKFRLKKAT